MRVLQAKTKRPLDLLSIGAGGHVAAASSAFGVRSDVEVWEIASGKRVYDPAGSEQDTSSITFHPDGKRLFIGSERMLCVLDLSTKTVVNLGGRVVFPELAFDGEGDRILLTYTRWEDEQSGIIEYREVKQVELMLASSDCLWNDAVNERTIYARPVVSADGNRVATSMHNYTRDRVRNDVHIRKAATGQRDVEIEYGGANPLLQLAFSADSTKLLARSSGRVVKVFDASTGQPAGELVQPGRPYVTGMAVHPNGTVACSRNNGTVCFWNLEKYELVRTLDWKLGKLVSVAFSPDGSLGAAGTEDGQVVVWDVDF